MDRVEVGRLEPQEWLGRRFKVVIDRPLGSHHPNGSFTYELNYGFVPGLVAPDGEELDAYVLGPTAAVDEFEGEVVAVVLRRDDVEDKLVVAASPYTTSEVTAAVLFQEQFFDSRVVTADSLT